MNIDTLLSEKPICAICNIPMNVKKNNVAIILGRDKHVFQCDLFECVCGNKVYGRFSREILRDEHPDLYYICLNNGFSINY